MFNYMFSQGKNYLQNQVPLRIFGLEEQNRGYMRKKHCHAFAIEIRIFPY